MRAIATIFSSLCLFLKRLSTAMGFGGVIRAIKIGFENGKIIGLFGLIPSILLYISAVFGLLQRVPEAYLIYVYAFIGAAIIASLVRDIDRIIWRREVALVVAVIALIAVVDSQNHYLGEVAGPKPAANGCGACSVDSYDPGYQGFGTVEWTQPKKKAKIDTSKTVPVKGKVARLDNKTARPCRTNCVVVGDAYGEGEAFGDGGKDNWGKWF